MPIRGITSCRESREVCGIYIPGSDEGAKGRRELHGICRCAHFCRSEDEQEKGHVDTLSKLIAL